METLHGSFFKFKSENFIEMNNKLDPALLQTYIYLMK
jgi:hypothetical protein